jgi:cation diffusion facilitator family transporter
MTHESGAVAGPPLARSDRFTSGLRAVGIGLFFNLALIVVKATVGVIGHSQGLVADAIHSGADLVNSSSVLASLLVSRRPADLSHPYGHGRAEALAAVFASFIIGTAGLVTAWEAIMALRAGRSEAPGIFTLWVAGAALLVKLGLYLYAAGVARRTRSKSVAADSRDHLTDAFASAIVIAGIAGARLGYPDLDTLGSFIVAGFVLYTAFEIFHDSADELMDTSLSGPIRAAIMESLSGVADVASVSGVAGRSLADSTVVEIHVDLDPEMRVADAARIADDIKQRIMTDVPAVTNVIVEMNSALEEPHRV